LTGDNGILEFFIEDGYGSVKNGVHIIENSNSISANRLDIYKRSKELYFQGNVRAIYENKIFPVFIIKPYAACGVLRWNIVC